jgi:hypothetical protein
MSTSATWSVIRRVDCTDQGQELSLRAIALVYPVVLYVKNAGGNARARGGVVQLASFRFSQRLNVYLVSWLSWRHGSSAAECSTTITDGCNGEG